MQKRYKVSRVFTTYPNGEVASAADLHATKMGSNPLFPTPPFKPADITTQNQTFRDKITAATGDKQDTAALNTAREVILDSMRANASYVETIASQFAGEHPVLRLYRGEHQSCAKSAGPAGDP